MGIIKDAKTEILNFGVYYIKNLTSDKLYIGCTTDLCNRWSQHKSTLRKNKHHNIHLQRAWNKYGIESFEKKDVFKQEDYWVKLYKADKSRFGYNIKSTGGYMNVKMSDGHRANVSIKNKQRSKKVVLIDGTNITYYKSISDVAKYFNVSLASMGSTIKRNNIYKNKFIIILEEDYDESANYYNIRKRNYRKTYNKKIEQYDSEGNFIREWNTIDEAAEKLNISRPNISLNCNTNKNINYKHKVRSAGGFIWKFKNV